VEEKKQTQNLFPSLEFERRVLSIIVCRKDGGESSSSIHWEIPISIPWQMIMTGLLVYRTA
jgi:hypothetical protein